MPKQSAAAARLATDTGLVGDGHHGDGQAALPEPGQSTPPRTPEAAGGQVRKKTHSKLFLLRKLSSDNSLNHPSGTSASLNRAEQALRFVIASGSQTINLEDALGDVVMRNSLAHILVLILLLLLSSYVYVLHADSCFC